MALPSRRRSHRKSRRRNVPKNAQTIRFSLRVYNTAISHYYMDALFALGNRDGTLITEKKEITKAYTVFHMKATTTDVETYRTLYYYVQAMNDVPRNMIRIHEMPYV